MVCVLGAYGVCMVYVYSSVCIRCDMKGMNNGDMGIEESSWKVNNDTHVCPHR